MSKGMLFHSFVPLAWKVRTLLFLCYGMGTLSYIFHSDLIATLLKMWKKILALSFFLPPPLPIFFHAFFFSPYPPPLNLSLLHSPCGVGVLFLALLAFSLSVICFLPTIDPFHRWLTIINSFVIIKISLTNLVFELIIQNNFYYQTSLVRLI